MNSGTAPELAAQIDDLLPQTQCTRCGYAACRPYAEAVAGGEAQINQCPPGGQATIDALARLLDRAWRRVPSMPSSAPQNTCTRF